MLTLFSCPKSFRGHIDIIQRNAIKSWVRLNPCPEIILIGKDDGVKEVCQEYNLKHIPDIEINEFGTPLVNTIFDKARSNASNDILCYINADIILFQNFIDIIQSVIPGKNNFLLVGQRWDLDITERIDYSDETDDTIIQEVKRSGKLHGPTGKDFFVFNKDLYADIPPFAIGRGVWDDWLVYYARKIKSPVIDLTNDLIIVHQNHDYAHISKEKKSFDKNIEWERNVKYAGGFSHAYHLYDANYMLINSCLINKSVFRLLYLRVFHFFRPYIYWLTTKRKSSNLNYPLSFFKGK